MGDKELTAVGPRPGVCHGKYSGAIVLERRNYLIGEAVTWAAAAVSLRVSALDHKVRDNPVEGKAVIIGFASGNVHFAFRKGDKITNRQRRFLKLKLHDNIAPVGAYPGK